MIVVALAVLIILGIAYGLPAAGIAAVGMAAVFIGTAKAAEDVRRTLEEDPDA